MLLISSSSSGDALGAERAPSMDSAWPGRATTPSNNVGWCHVSWSRCQYPEKCQIVSVIPQSPDSWQVDWMETVRDRQGFVKIPPYRMRALVTTYVAEPASDVTEEQIRNNPLGIYVRDFAWAKQV